MATGSARVLRNAPGVALAVTLAVVAGACGTAPRRTGGAVSTTTSPQPSAASTGAAAAGRPNAAAGTVAAVSGSTVEVQSPRTGQVTVDVTPSTVVTTTVSTGRSSLAAGDCVVAFGRRSSSGAVDAVSMSISTPSATGCGAPRRQTRPRPGTAPKARGRRRRGGGLVAVGGDVSSAQGSTVVVRTRSGSTQQVMLSGSTRYLETATASASAIKAGECLVAAGPTNQIGTVTATRVRISPPAPGGCSAGAGRFGATGGGAGG